MHVTWLRFSLHVVGASRCNPASPGKSASPEISQVASPGLPFSSNANLFFQISVHHSQNIITPCRRRCSSTSTTNCHESCFHRRHKADDPAEPFRLPFLALHGVRASKFAILSSCRLFVMTCALLMMRLARRVYTMRHPLSFIWRPHTLSECFHFAT